MSETPRLLRAVVAAPPNNNNIKVAVRVRPPNQRELAGGGNEIIISTDNSSVSVEMAKHPISFEFDHAFGHSVNNADLFEHLGVPIVQNAFHGFNVTLFAYGQTSSGKSYSMVGRIPHGASAASKDVDPGVGIIPRVASLLFATVDSMPETHEFLVEVSFLEICE
jgi:hypothetical protein